MPRRGQILGKYRLVRRIAEGGFAQVWESRDEILGRKVALKVLGPTLGDTELTDAFLCEVRIAADLEHPNVLPVRNADILDDFCIAESPLGTESLYERLQRRLPPKLALNYAGQLLDGLAYAHSHRIIHCDVKPGNCILFPGDRLRVGDFGLAKIAHHSLRGSGSGTLGYLAPEQAMGRPSFRSDVFAAGLVIWRLFTGQLPEWPFDWPPPGIERARKVLHRNVIECLHRAMEVRARDRYPSMEAFRDAFKRLRSHALRQPGGTSATRKAHTASTKDWRNIRFRQCARRYGRALALQFECGRCGGPVAEAMDACPWCGRTWKRHRADTREAARCTRCGRGVKRDWRFCPWCWGGAIGPSLDRHLTDRRYSHRCGNRGCGRGDLWPFMRYCPWCHRKVRKPWRTGILPDACPSCRWGVAKEYWEHCPWCTKPLRSRTASR